METHGNHLHHAPGGGWKHYMFEFVMLFLAVFCGFLAENFREHQVEKERGRQYLKSFYEDLKTDTAIIASHVAYEELKIEGFRNFRDCFTRVSDSRKEAACMLDLARSSIAYRPFQMTDRTVRQLGNAGGFRLLEREEADSIMKYEAAFKAFHDYQSTFVQGAQDKVRSTFNQVFNFEANMEMMDPKPGQELLVFHDQVSGPLLFTSDQALLNQYFNELLLYYKAIIVHQKRMRDLKNNQERLIGFFNSKYHFE